MTDMTRARRIALFVAVIGLAGAAAALVLLGRRSADGSLGDPDDPRQVAHGAGVYAHHCAACHGAALEGAPDWRARKPNGRLPAPPHDATGHTWHHPDQDLFRIVTIGLRPPLAPEGYESDMPPFAGVLADAEIWAVLAFIKSTWPPDLRERQRGVTERSTRR